MTPRERLLKVLSGQLPDRVPASPDISNMIPARLTGKPFWDIYLYNDPPIWEAYIEAAKHFGIDALMDGYFPLTFEGEHDKEVGWEKFIVFRSDERIVTQRSRVEKGRRLWQKFVDVYYVADPPTEGVRPESIGLGPVPAEYELVVGAKTVDIGPSGLARMKELMGEQGLVGVEAATTCWIRNERDVYDYFDNPAKYERLAEEKVEQAQRRFANIMRMPVKPDFLCVGCSGTLVFQTFDMFMRLAFPAVKRIIELASEANLPTHVHSCGPEKELVRIFAEQTNLTVIDPLEEPPMGDCDLAQLKKLYGDRIVLKGNLHTTDVMLHGSVDDVTEASRRAIQAGAEGGRFILSTGDQCGRDTPDENIRAVVKAVERFGKY